MTNQTRREFLGSAGRWAVLGLGVGPVLSALTSGCSNAGSLSTLASNAGSVMKVSKAVSKSFQDITPEQEYYIGRTVGAMVLDKYKPYNNQKAITYLNVMGQTLAQASDMPETFGGYHFLLLDSEEINAFAAPGGLIFITRGMVRCCTYEDSMAAVLAHEIGHVQHKHGLQAIKKSRLTSALTTIGAEGAKAFGGETLSKLTQTFEDSITDITSTMINNGYSRSFEREADRAAVTILKRVGYDPNGLVDMLRVMEQKLKPGGSDFAKTHPSPASRIEDIQKSIGEYAEVKTPKARKKRFKRTLQNV
ncbi:MAG: M48 family metallopeptidase [Deltaproteobacteria bacterium]|nr:M48 family metallopeptidase [Deltaproteobacteria bacterium]